MKKILIFSLAYLPKHASGAELAIKEITDRIPDIEFHLVTCRFDSALSRVERVGNVLVHRIGMTRPNPSATDLRRFPLHLNKALFQFLAAWHAWRLHRTHRYDAVWAMMAHSAGVPAAIFKLLHPRIPYVLTLQEGDPPEAIERTMLPLWPLFSQTFRSADVITAISTFLGKWARHRGFKGPLEIIPNGVDIAHFSQESSPRAIDEIRDRLGKKMGDVFLVTTSRLVYKNAVDDVISALRLLPENVKFIVIGSGPLENELKLQATSYKLQARVQFLGQVDHREVPKYLRACDIFIRASRSEGFGSSFVEAFAAGLPVIATQEGGLIDFLFDEKRNPDKPITGWAVDKNSPGEIAAAVKDIMSHPEKVRAVVATTRAVVVKKYDWDVIVQVFADRVFKRVLQMPGKGV